VGVEPSFLDVRGRTGQLKLECRGKRKDGKRGRWERPESGTLTSPNGYGNLGRLSSDGVKNVLYEDGTETEPGEETDAPASLWGANQSRKIIEKEG